MVEMSLPGGKLDVMRVECDVVLVGCFRIMTTNGCNDDSNNPSVEFNESLGVFNAI